ncbi:MAG: hypothetical protein PVI07_17425, partial [Anaerolineae bacterium]
NGISRFHPSAGSGQGAQSWTRYTTAHGLVDNETWSILVAPDGTVWASSINGISRYTSSPRRAYDGQRPSGLSEEVRK